mmetsp:Transcript_22606/g.67818  ORF Transcript_22606/g.67818 Transcript_22606/m.67818 type:complete len:326 (+) Transcript_22606:244-1221(+)|eukprot:CAMPEP_0119264620 /NCGR_PEP_ID=MMETSP1329-20130426/3657_1 /TAXON_ID=114041 /ORGANISM="Genus nov. species nov., Strain RCC1024" /LENGTH=325 /DNA_ID=CAMNT_0007264403 /DNA_START=223 /DNA_END=1200 /DNA_ORIENTATION=+
MGRKRAAAPLIPWRSPRRRSPLTEGLSGILEVVLGRGTDVSSLTCLRATCRTLRDILGSKNVAAVRLADDCAHVLRALPKAASLVGLSALLADNVHLQLEEGVADVASLTGSWDQYVVNELNWRARWPEARNTLLSLRGPALQRCREALATPWRGIGEIETAGGQMYVDEGACVRFEYAVPRGPSRRLLAVEILSSRWTLSAEMRADREIRALRDIDGSEAPALRVYAAAAKGNDAARPRPEDLLPGSTSVEARRSSVAAASFEAPAPPAPEGPDAFDEWTYVYTIKYKLDKPADIGDRRVLVEVDCRDHDCNAAIHNIFLEVAH